MSELWRVYACVTCDELKVSRGISIKFGLNFGESEKERPTANLVWILERERERESPDNSWILEWKINKQAQERPESPTVFSPGMRVNTRYINTRGTSSVGCMYHWWSLCTLYWGSDSGGVYVPCIGVVTGGVYGPCIYLRARWELL